MLGKYIALYKYYCKVAPAVWRSRGQQCTGECKHPSLSRGISVVHWGQSIPRAHQRGNGKAWGKRSHQCNAAGTVKLGCTIGRIQQKPGNWIWDICGCSQHLEVQISLRCHKIHVPCCSVLCYSPRRKVRPVCIKRGSMGKEKRVTVSDCSFFFHFSGAFVLLPWLQIWFLQTSFSVWFPFTPLHISACFSELPPGLGTCPNET